MGFPSPKINIKTFVLPLLGLTAFVLYLFFFNVDLQSIAITIQQIDTGVYVLAIVAVLLETLFFTLSWRVLLSYLRVKLSVMKAFLFVWYGIFMDIVIPAESISGEVSRIYLVTREQNGTSGQVVASLVLQRLIGMSINVGTLLVGVSILLMDRPVLGLVFNLTMFLAITMMVGLTLLILLCLKDEWILKVITKILEMLKYLKVGQAKIMTLKSRLTQTVKMFKESIRQFGKSPATVVTSSLLNVLSWVFGLAVAYIVFLAMRFPVRWNVIVITYSIVVAIKSIPAGVPFEVGLPEITMTTMYVWLGIPVDVAATATVLTRILTLWLRFFIGFAAQQWLEIKVRSTKPMRNLEKFEK